MLSHVKESVLVLPREMPPLNDAELSDTNVRGDRYLSRSQEWSENMRIKEQTRHIKNTLDPVWNEDFSLPIRR